MQRLRELSKQITELTVRIEEDFPELYQHLDENPVTLSNTSGDLDISKLTEYLDSLREILEHYIVSQKV